MIGIPWDGPSVIVPAKAIEVLHQFNQNFNYVPLGQCRDCNNCGELFKYCEEIEVLIDDTSAFCFKFQPREACQNSDKKQMPAWKESSGIFAGEILKDSMH